MGVTAAARCSGSRTMARNPRASGASLLLGGDLGCLMNMAGKLKRKGSSVRSFHAAEVLAGMAGGPAIGEER